MKTDAESCAEHWNRVVALCAELQPIDVALYDHSDSFLPFGSWSLTLGRRKKVLRFTSDGKDEFLYIHEAIVSDSRTIMNWNEVKVQEINISSESEPFAEVSSFARARFAV